MAPDKRKYTLGQIRIAVSTMMCARPRAAKQYFAMLSVNVDFNRAQP